MLAAGALVAIKLGTGLATDSLGLLSEALHSGTDLVAALLTLFAVGVAVRPADRSHAYGHGKAENLAALAEAAILALLSLLVAFAAIRRFGDHPELEIDWWVFAVLGLVIAVDASRMAISFRAARRYESAAFASNASARNGSMATVFEEASYVLERNSCVSRPLSWACCSVVSSA